MDFLFCIKVERCGAVHAPQVLVSYDGSGRHEEILEVDNFTPLALALLSLLSRLCIM